MDPASAQRERNDATRLAQLEQRRGDNDRAMWLAPLLTMTAQAFLLQILSNEDVSCWTRTAVLCAGLAATFTAIWTVVRARSREVLYSEAIQVHLERCGVRDVRPQALRKHLPGKNGDGWRKIDNWLIRVADRDGLPAPYFCWVVALFTFALADIAAFAG